MSNSMTSRLFLGALIMAAVGTSACSVYMEETRPEPTRLDQFQPGESRDEVMEKLGPPITSTDYAAMNCELYQLYVSGYGEGGKVPIALVETAADVFTLGLAEVVSTPVEASTRNQKSPVWFCYKKDALAKVIPGHLPVETAAAPAAAASPSAAAIAKPSVQAASASMPASGLSTVKPTTAPAPPESETE